MLCKENKKKILQETLEIPNLFLKRLFTKSSNIEQEILEKRNQYKKTDANLNRKLYI